MTGSSDTPTPILDERLEPTLAEFDPKVISNRYTIIGRLGEGGMGKVYHAIDPVLQRHVAVKVLPFKESYSDEHLLRFQQEARAASKLNHPGIVMALDFGVTEKQEPYLVMEYIEGETLDAVLKKNGKMEFEEFISIFTQIIKALNHAHSAGVVHRDLKPSNIMICSRKEGEKAYVLDFGIAKILDDTGSIANTKTGVVVGSPRCISPEQVYCGPLDGRTDIYSLGCVMFEALTGSPLFKGATAMETIQMHLNEEPPRLSERLDGISDGLERLIAKTLAKKPEDRFQSTAGLLAALEALVTLGNEEIQHEPEQDKEKPSLKASGSLFILAIAAFIVFVGFVATAGFLVPLVSTDSEEPPPKDLPSSVTADDNRWQLYAQGLKNYDESLKLLRHGPDEKLFLSRVLVLSNTNLGPHDWKRLSKCVDLEHLDLSHCGVTDEDLHHLSSLKKLKTLVVVGCSVTREGCEKVFGANQKLKIQGALPAVGFKPPLVFWGYKQQKEKSLLPMVDTIVNEGKKHERESLRALKSKTVDKSRQVLNLHGTRVSNEDLRNLSNFPKLQSLGLNDTHITSLGVRHIVSKATNSLKDLHLKYVQLDSNDLAEIAKIKSLQHVTIAQCGNLNDDAIKQLAKLRHLNRLDVSGTEFTPAGLIHFRQRPNLTIAVSNCKGFNNANLKDLAKEAGIKEVTTGAEREVVCASNPVKDLFTAEDPVKLKNLPAARADAQATPLHSSPRQRANQHSGQ